MIQNMNEYQINNFNNIYNKYEQTNMNKYQTNMNK